MMLKRPARRSPSPSQAPPSLRERALAAEAESARLRHGVARIVGAIERSRAGEDERTVIDAEVIERHLRALL